MIYDLTKPKNKGVYLLRNKINGKVYIGKSIQLKQRFINHKKDGRTLQNDTVISRAINKHGWENFQIEILESYYEIENELLLQIEAYYIKKYDSTNKEIGYNILSFSTDRTGHKASEETKRKMSLAHSGEKHHFYGKHHSAQAKEKLSNFFSGRILSEEHKNSISKGLLKTDRKGINSPIFGRKLTKEHCKKISLANKGDKHHFFGKSQPQEVIEKIRKTKTGTKQSEEHKQNISKGLIESYRTGKRISRKGQKASEETKRKMSESLKGKTVKSVCQIRKETGEIIKIWSSIREATISLGKKENSGGISNACNGRAKSAYGYIWKFYIPENV